MASFVVNATQFTWDQQLMSIFADISRPDVGPPEHGEPGFPYLNRSGRPEADRVRRLVDEWIARYPTSSRDNLVSRFQSLNDDAHHSAFFELFIHELVIAHGHKVVAVEPKLSHTAKSPDFLIEPPRSIRCIWSVRWRQADPRRKPPCTHG